MQTVFIGIGANLGNPLAQCQRAVEQLGDLPQTTLTACSSFYRSEPLVPEGENTEGIPPYVNAVCQVQTGLKPRDLLEHLQRIEKKMGRVQRTRWASREIDLDILLMGDRRMATEEVIIPHPEMHRRAFVLKPFSEIAPDTVHPVLRKTVAQLAESLENGLDVKKIEWR